MIDILICDDEQIWIDSLVKEIDSVINVEHKFISFLDSDELLEYVSKNSSDIIIIDIQLPKTSGIEVAKRIYKDNKRTQIIFTSISKNYIQDVFAVKPVYYLTKPFNSSNVEEALLIALENLCANKQTIKVISNGKTVNLMINDISYIESDRRTVIFHHNNTKSPSLMKLDSVEEILPPNFVRAHKSYLINMNEIKRISNNEIELFDGTILPVAKSRFKQTKQIILDYWNSRE